MNISIKLLDSLTTIDKRIKEAMADEINKRLRVAKGKIIKEAMGSIYHWVQTLPEMQAMIDDGPGSLSAMFGLEGSARPKAVLAIARSVVESTEVEVTYYNKMLKNGGLWLKFQPANFKNLLSLPEGENQAYPEGHWLRHLLLSGNQTIVVGYHYTPGRGGRSGGGTMTSGGAWRVPPQYAGDEGNNFITRAFEGREKQIADIFSRALKF